MHSILEKAVEEHRRRRFLEDVNAAYSVMREDPEVWEEVEAERSAWDVTMGDGLQDENWTAGGAVDFREEGKEEA